ncbi:MAG TPA: hypothetical protein VGS12_11230, partial [Caulobacteraceae bacterium]|nr:hypothetical protein [Caulobacteraceae bacterium]
AAGGVTATAVGGLTAGAYATEYGGAGGAGVGGTAAGGPGAAASLLNAVSASAGSGYVKLREHTYGGAGGDSAAAGAGPGGAGYSGLTATDSTASAVSAHITASGGLGGSAGIGGNGANGGAAKSILSVTAAHDLGVVAQAVGGNGGAGGVGGAGGNAKAKAKAVGTQVSAFALAQAGDGTTDGIASAKVNATGTSGNAIAATLAPRQVGVLVQAASAGVTDGVSGTTILKAKSQIGVATFAPASSGAGVANVTGAPQAADTDAVLNAPQNASIKTAFGASPTFFSLAEMGGGYTSGGSGSQTVTSVVDLTIDLTKLASRADLVIGFHDPITVGSGFSSLTFTLVGDGQTLISQTFTTLAAAQTYFSDHALDLGSLASGALSNNTLGLQATLTLTETSAGAGFYVQAIVGDPPGAAAGGPARFLEAMASTGAAAMAHASAPGWDGAAAPNRLLLARA